jgi:peroxiredoxin Q/BCP
MPSIAIGKPIPAFKLDSTGGPVNLSVLKGKKTVLYFYPKDNTPGCTLEGQDFRDNLAKFTRAGAQVFGISRDSLKSHENFKSKQSFTFELISDPDEALCRIFDVIKMKNMYGKKVRGIERSTFLLDEKAVLRQEWRKVKVTGHIEEVLSAVKAL